MKHSYKRRATAVYLNPAEIVIAEVPSTVTTVLGSCVAVALFSPRTRFGAICHGVLPYGQEREPGKYIDQAVKHMIDFFREINVNTNELIAKVFGGADMFPQTKSTGIKGTIGTQNIHAALTTLELVGITPKVVEVGGQQGRKLVFFSDTGDVYIKRIRNDQMKAAGKVLLLKKCDYH